MWPSTDDYGFRIDNCSTWNSTIVTCIARQPSWYGSRLARSTTTFVCTIIDRLRRPHRQQNWYYRDVKCRRKTAQLRNHCTACPRRSKKSASCNLSSSSLAKQQMNYHYPDLVILSSQNLKLVTIFQIDMKLYSLDVSMSCKCSDRIWQPMIYKLKRFYNSSFYAQKLPWW